MVGLCKDTNPFQSVLVKLLMAIKKKVVDSGKCMINFYFSTKLQVVVFSIH